VKTAVKVCDESGKPGICGLNAGNTFQTHFFDQSILKCLIRTFHAAFSFRAVGTNKLDCQVIKHTSELGNGGIAVLRTTDAKYCVFVTVQRYRLPMLLNVFRVASM
jgi:hypothetical protein